MRPIVDDALNWLWQGSFVAIVAALLLALARATPARARYRIAALALAAVVLLPVLSIRPKHTMPAASTTGAPSAAVVFSLPDNWWTSDRLVVGLWVVWVIAAGSRVAIGLVAFIRARRSCRPFPVAIETGLSQWMARPAGRTARLVLTDRVRSAAVLAGPTPLIAVNPSLIESLEAGDLDRVIMHEWAHVERRDDLALFLQLAGRVVAGWHPAAWWLDRRLQFEREVACDEHVVRLSGSAKAYAQCLATLARLSPVQGGVLPAVGAGPGSHLRQRVARILQVPQPPRWPIRAVLAGASVVPVAAAAGIADLRMIGAVPAGILAQVAATAPHVDDVTEPAASSAAAPAKDTATAQTLAPRVAPLRHEDPLRPADGAATRAFDMAAIGMSDDEVDPAPGSDVPILAPLASGVAWAFTALPDRAAVTPAPGLADLDTPPPNAPTLWGAAATGGVALGRGGQKAAVSTAGFFARAGKSIAGSF